MRSHVKILVQVHAAGSSPEKWATHLGVRVAYGRTDGPRVSELGLYWQRIYRSARRNATAGPGSLARSGSVRKRQVLMA
jgi:hypothetical protein